MRVGATRLRRCSSPSEVPPNEGFPPPSPHFHHRHCTPNLTSPHVPRLALLLPSTLRTLTPSRARQARGGTGARGGGAFKLQGDGGGTVACIGPGLDGVGATAQPVPWPDRVLKGLGGKPRRRCRAQLIARARPPRAPRGGGGGGGGVGKGANMCNGLHVSAYGASSILAPAWGHGARAAPDYWHVYCRDAGAPNPGG